MSRLNFITSDPPNAGTPQTLLDGSLLSPDDVYMRNNFAIPQDAPDRVHVSVPGRRFTVSVADLRAMTSTDIAMVLECAGNGRRFMDPVPDGTPWDMGGVSPVRFSGVPLVDVVGPVSPEVTELVFTGADSGEEVPGQHINYQFSAERAVWDRAILALDLDGVPLTRDHGGPIRLVVPGHYAMKSVKWVSTIAATVTPFSGHFVEKYRYFSDAVVPEAAPVGEIQVRSLISHPDEGEAVSRGRLTISGSAWSGSGGVAAVEVSIDEGHTWSTATTSRQTSRFAAVGWSTHVDLAPGTYRVLSRATDAAGNTQPIQPRWNANGYGNNVVYGVTFRVT